MARRSCFVWAIMISVLVLDHGVRAQLCLPRGESRMVKLSCKQNSDLFVTARGNDVVLAPDTGNDSQVWIQYYTAQGNRVTDDEGEEVFSLYNKATRKTMVFKDQTFSDGFIHVQLLDVFNSCNTYLSTLWTMGDDSGGSYSEIRAFRDISMVLDALGGNAQDGTFVGVYGSQKPEVDNALWTMTFVSNAVN